MDLHKRIGKKLNGHAESFRIDQVNKLNLPKSLLIIPDGNGRWAKNLGLSVFEGHKAGGKTFSEILKRFVQINIDVLGAWGFSEDNWKRSKEETEKIMEVIETTARENLDFMMENNIKFMVLGNRERIQKEFPSLCAMIDEATQKTAKNTGKTLVIFIDYGERFQLEEFAKARMKYPDLSTYQVLSKINNGLPLFDMVLRTSGELRLSGFGPLADLAEFVSVKKNLPDMTDFDLIKALREYSGRQRRFGARPS